MGAQNIHAGVPVRRLMSAFGNSSGASPVALSLRNSSVPLPPKLPVFRRCPWSLFRCRAWCLRMLWLRLQLVKILASAFELRALRRSARCLVLKAELKDKDR